MRGFGAILAVAVLLAGCAATVTSPSPPASSIAQSVRPSASDPPSPGSSLTPLPSPAGSLVPPTSTPKPTPKPTQPQTMTNAELELVDQLRKDARVDCRPRRTDLPWGSDAGVECFVDSALVNRVGVYGFTDEEALKDFESPEGLAATHYFVTLADYGVDAGSGDCRNGIPGDASWPAYLADEGDGPHGLRSLRWGCYRDEYNHANVRVTCYGGVYIGILGKTSDIKALSRWTWKLPGDQSPDRDPPGICEYPD